MARRRGGCPVCGFEGLAWALLGMMLLAHAMPPQRWPKRKCVWRVCTECGFKAALVWNEVSRYALEIG